MDKERKRILFNWAFSMFCLSCIIAYGFTLGSVLLFLLGLFSMPITFFKELRSKVPVNKKVMVGIIAVLFVIFVSILPERDNTKSSDDITTEDSTLVADLDMESEDVAKSEEITENVTTEKATTERATEEKTEVTTTEKETAQEVTTTESIVQEVATTEAPAIVETQTEEPAASVAQETYVINTNTGKFHYSWCSSVGQMNNGNRWDYTGTRDDVIGMGYSPCKKCNP